MLFEFFCEGLHAEVDHDFFDGLGSALLALGLDRLSISVQLLRLARCRALARLLLQLGVLRILCDGSPLSRYVFKGGQAPPYERVVARLCTLRAAKASRLVTVEASLAVEASTVQACWLIFIGAIGWVDRRGAHLLIGVRRLGSLVCTVSADVASPALR